MDSLKESARAFEKLLDKEYLITIARKGIATEFRIIFEAEDFKHLAGIQYLDDIFVHSMLSRKLFYGALDETVKEEHLQSSINFDYIQERLKNLKNLENYLDNNMNVFKWDGKNAQYTRIKADYMLRENTTQQNKAYIFVKEKDGIRNNNKKLKISEIKAENAVSFFLNKQTDYSKDQVSYTLLKNEKFDKSTGIRTTLYNFEEIKREKIVNSQKAPVLIGAAKATNDPTPLNQSIDNISKRAQENTSKTSAQGVAPQPPQQSYHQLIAEAKRTYEAKRQASADSAYQDTPIKKTDIDR